MSVRLPLTRFFFECAKARVVIFGRGSREEDVGGGVGHGGAKGVWKWVTRRADAS